MWPLNFCWATIYWGLVTLCSSQSYYANSQPGLEVSLEESSSFPETSPFSFSSPLAYFAVAAASPGLSVVCVYTGSLMFLGPTVSLGRPPSRPPSASTPHTSLLLCVVFSYSSGPPFPLALLLLCTSTSFAGRASLPGVVWKTWGYLLFKGLVPYAVLAGEVVAAAGVQRCVFSVEGKMPS